MHRRTVSAVLVGLAAALLPATALAEEIELRTGEVLKATIVDRAEDALVVDHPVLGRIAIPNGGIVAIRLEPGQTVASDAGEAGTVPTPAPAPQPPPQWKFSGEVGINGASGNTNSFDLRAAIRAVTEDEHQRTKAEAVYSTGRSESVTTKNQVRTELRRDWLFKDSPWSIFGNLRYEWDEFEEWDGRAMGSLGAGYQIRKSETFDLRGRMGINILREFGSADDSIRPEGLLGLESRWKINDAQSLETAVTYYPDLEDLAFYRIESEATWSIKLADDGSLLLKLGVRDEYDEHRTDPFDRNDFEYFAALQFEF